MSLAAMSVTLRLGLALGLTALIWLVLCLAGFMGRIANTAHVAGLLIGLIWGWVSAYQARRRSE